MSQKQDPPEHSEGMGSHFDLPSKSFPSPLIGTTSSRREIINKIRWKNRGLLVKGRIARLSIGGKQQKQQCLIDFNTNSHQHPARDLPNLQLPYTQGKHQTQRQHLRDSCFPPLSRQPVPPPDRTDLVSKISHD